MPIYNCGYIIQQDYLKPFVMKETHEEEEEEEEEGYTAQSLLVDINAWWYHLPRDTRRRTPLPDIYVPDGKSGYETGVIWIRSRRFIEAEGPETLSEIEADKIVKRRFLEAIGKGFNENQMVFLPKSVESK
ncbi:hypothetical protein BDZ97DRAFT_1921846 [Flammula alnicola]|nr:hypothetical protein BDZ97DRAFT_1921846 [Flammula alnicola]